MPATKQLYVEEEPRGLPVPDRNAWVQYREWERQGRLEEAEALAPVARQPMAAWFTAGTPDEVGHAVAQTVAGADGAVPVLVAYNLPLRDCSQYSAGGAEGMDAYRRWIDASPAVWATPRRW
jgi:endoglucanase